MDENKKMREAIRKTFEAMYGQTGELKSDFDKLRILEHAIISNLGEFREKPEPEIVPAEAFTEPLEAEQLYYYPSGGTFSCSRWDNDEVDYFRLKDKMIFPNTIEGKLGAELRAKVPHPGIHWQEDIRKLRDAMDVWTSVPYGNRESDARFGIKVYAFLDKYMNDL